MTEQNTVRSEDENIAKSGNILIQDLFNSYAGISDKSKKAEIEQMLKDALLAIYGSSENPGIKVWTDGSYDPNTGRAGIGVIIISDDKLKIFDGKTI